MSISPSDFLASAKLLLLRAEQEGEVAIRNAISRAYYAAFHQTRAIFPADRDFAKNAGTGMHEAYIDQLMQADTGSSERHAAVKLKSLKGRRANADYRLDDDLPTYHAAMQVNAAEEVFRLLDQPSSPPPRPNETPSTTTSEPELATALVGDDPDPPRNRPKLQRIR